MPDVPCDRHVSAARGGVRGVLGGTRHRRVPAVRRRVRVRSLRTSHAQVRGVPHAAATGTARAAGAAHSAAERRRRRKYRIRCTQD